MTSVADRLAAVRQQIAAACVAAGRDPSEVALLAVSKRQPIARVEEVLTAGQHDLGESRVQELVERAGQLGKCSRLRWHMIGSLQTNKVRDLLSVDNLALVHSVDRPKLVAALQDELSAQGRSLDVLLQVNATGEAQKHGVTPEDAPALLEKVQSEAPCLNVQGVMAMGPLSGEPGPVFDAVAALVADLRTRSGLPLQVLSLGMTHDLEAAVRAGSTMVRVGTGVFGSRD